MEENLTVENLRNNFEKVISDLNKIMNFCRNNDISFEIGNYNVVINNDDNDFKLEELRKTIDL